MTAETKKVKKTVEKKANKLTIDVFDTQGQIEKEITLPASMFDIKAKPALLAQYVRVYLANQRQGTQSVKTRGEVSGTTKKIYRQKGTGRARHGSAKAPIFVGGGVTHAPKPRDYSLSINKKQKKIALYAALSMKLQQKAILGLSDKFLKIEPKTKNFAQFLKTLKLEENKNLLIVPTTDKKNLVLAVRNIKNLEIADVSSINPYTILNSGKILLLEQAVNLIGKNLK